MKNVEMYKKMLEKRIKEVNQSKWRSCPEALNALSVAIIALTDLDMVSMDFNDSFDNMVDDYLSKL